MGGNLTAEELRLYFVLCRSVRVAFRHERLSPSMRAELLEDAVNELTTHAAYSESGSIRAACSRAVAELAVLPAERAVSA